MGYLPTAETMWLASGTLATLVFDASKDDMAECYRVGSRQSLVACAVEEIRFLMSRRHLVSGLVASSLQAVHTNTLMGALWWLLTPMLDASVYFFVVGVVFRSRQAIFPLFILCAVLPWKCFVDGCLRSIAVIAGNYRLMRQVRFPRTASVLAWVLAAHASLIFAVPVFVGLQVYFGTGPSVMTPAVVLLVVPQIALCIGLALFLAAVNCYFRDTSHLAAYLFHFWFFASPSLYSVDQVPPWLMPYYRLNPFCSLFEGYRAVLMRNQFLPLDQYLVLTATALSCLTIGFLVFCRLQREMTKVL